MAQSSRKVKVNELQPGMTIEEITELSFDYASLDDGLIRFLQSTFPGATAVLVGHVAGGTKTIRVGSGGVMLPNHAPLVIAEQFGTLEALYPGRIDLGIGRAPGTDRMTAYALRRNLAGDVDDFPRDVLELQNYFRTPQPGQPVQAVPGAGLNVDGTRYFWYHHSDADTIDKLDAREFNECVAALAVLAEDAHGHPLQRRSGPLDFACDIRRCQLLQSVVMPLDAGGIRDDDECGEPALQPEW